MGQLFEAIVIGALVLGAIGFAVAFQAPPPPSANPNAQNLGEKTWDAMAALDRMHYPDESYGNSTLSKGIADAAAGNPQPLVQSMKQFLPTGARLQLYLNNGYDQFPLYTNETPSGQTVGVTYPFEPNWRFHYGATDLRLYNANTSTSQMDTILAPLFNSNHVQDEGQFVRASVTGEYPFLPGRGIQNPNDPFSRPFSTDAYTTLLQGDETTSYPSASIYLECKRDPDDEPCYAIDLTEDPIDGYAPQQRSTELGTIRSQRLDLVVENDGPGNVSAGTTLTVEFPVGLEVSENASSPDGSLVNVTHLDSPPDPQTVHAEIPADGLGPGDTATVHIWVNRTDTRYAYKQIQATLDGGAVSQSQFLALVQDKTKGTMTGGDARRVLVSTPKPAGSATDPRLPSGRWAVVMPAPIADHTIEEVTLDITQGRGHIHEAKLPGDFNPTWPDDSTHNGPVQGDPSVPSPTTVRWDPVEIWGTPHEVPAYAFLEIQFNLTLDGTKTQASPQFPYTRPRTEFTGYQPPAHAVQVEPGIWTRPNPPVAGQDTPTQADDLPGYGASATDPTDQNPVPEGTFENRLVYRNTLVQGDATYRLADLGNANQGAIKDVLQTAELSVDPQRATPGETVDMSLDIEDLATWLSENGNLNDLNLTTTIYAPWGVPSRTPARTYTHEAAAGTAASPHDLLPARVNDDNAQDLLVANGDGNVYTISGDSGNLILERTFALPGDGSPNLLAKTAAPLGQVYAVGTTSKAPSWYALDATLEQRWAANKYNPAGATLGVNTSLDLTGDGNPDIVASHPAPAALENSKASRITAWNARDVDNDGTGDHVDGWNPNEDTHNGHDGVVVPGRARELGMGRLGARADPGVYANTGMEVSETVDRTVDSTVDAIQEGDLDGATNLSYEAQVRGSGLVGFSGDGRRAWNYSGGSFVHTATTPKLDTGGDWSGIVASDRLGWVYGFNGSQPIPPVQGWSYDTPSTMNDVAMANELEGYVASEDGVLFATRNGWTTMRYYTSRTVGSAAPEITYPGVQAVDTPDAPPYGDGGNVSWWVGDAGMVLRSTDRLATVDELTTTATLVGVVNAGSSGEEIQASVYAYSDPVTAEATVETTVQMSKIDLQEVYAVDEDEAWLVGEGRDGTGLGSYGYILHTADGGGSFTAIRVSCLDDGTLLNECGVNDVTSDGENLWAVGDRGLVLTLNRGGMRDQVALEGSPGPNGNGVLPLNLTSTKSTPIDEVGVGWSPQEKLDYGRSLAIRNDTEPVDLWNTTGTTGDHYIGSDADYLATHGYANGARLLVGAYVTNVSSSDDADRYVNGSSDDVTQLLVGPFKKAADPSGTDEYYPGSKYDGDGLLDLAPLNVTVNVTYDDGSEDLFWVEIDEDGAVHAREITHIKWKDPGNLTYGTPNVCFGDPDAECATYHGVNLTRAHPDGLGGAVVGQRQADGTEAKPQAPLVRMTPGSDTFEPAWGISLNETYTDAAVNPQRPDEWVAVGHEGRVIKSFDAGGNWTSLPTPAATGLASADTLRAIDYTNPATAYVVGGNASAKLWTVDGYREFGRTHTKPLERTSESAPGALERIRINASKLTIGDAATGSSAVRVDVWDAGLDRWVMLYNSTTGWVNASTTGWGATTSSYVFAEETSDLELRFTLSTMEGFSRFSPQLEGTLNVTGWTDDHPTLASPSDVTLSGDLAKPGLFERLDGLRHSSEHGFLRLPGATNLWVTKLGNHGAGDWSDASASGNAPQIEAADLAPNRTDLYVATGGIYDVSSRIGAGGSTSTTSSGQLLDEDDTKLWDSSLYRINVSTGRVREDWGPIHFSQPITMVEAGDSSVYVHTKDPASASGDEETYRYSVGESSDYDSAPVEQTRTVLDLARIDAFHAEWPGWPDDLVRHVKLDGTEHHYLEAFRSPPMEWVWPSTPEAKANFDFAYDVPRHALYGAHLAVTEFKWTTTDDRGEDVIQTARLHNSFDVTPRPNRVPLAPSYNLDAIVWMEDWE